MFCFVCYGVYGVNGVFIFLGNGCRLKRDHTVFENRQESGRNDWATRSSVRSSVRTAHSFACSTLLASLRCAPLHLLVCSLDPE